MIEAYAMLGILCRYFAFYATRLEQLRPWRDAAETGERSGRVGQERGRSFGAGRPHRALEEREHPLLPVTIELDQRHELVVDKPCIRVQQKTLAPRHARTE